MNAAVVFDGDMMDDENILGEDWRAQLAAVANVEVLPGWNLAEARDTFGRPLHLLCKLAGLSEAGAAEVLGWTPEKVKLAAVRDIQPGAFSLAEYLEALAKLTLILSASIDQRYAQIAWASEGEYSYSAADAPETFAQNWAAMGGGLTQARGIGSA